MSQTDAIIRHMQKFGSIEPLTALDRFGCFRLAARIRDLKDMGYVITTEKCERKGKYYARYRLIK